MIVLYRQEKSAEGTALELALRELVAAHRVELVRPEHPLPAPLDGKRLPAIVDGERVVYGDALPGYLAELAHELAEWRKYQVDACYVDDDGETC